MIVRLSEDATAYQMWVAEGHSEEELKKGLALGYIEYSGIRMKIRSIQAAQNPVSNGLVRKYVWVDMDKETANMLDATFLRKRN